MSLFGGHSKHHNFDAIAESLRTHLGLKLARPSNEVLEALEHFTPRELHLFNNLHSVEGMQALFHARSIRALVEPQAHLVALFLLTPEDFAQESSEIQRHTLKLGDRHAGPAIVPPPAPTMLPTPPPTPLLSVNPATSLPAGLEHLDAFEILLPQIVDLFLRHGRLNTGDKDVLKQIHPADSSIESRLSALERWQAEVSRRVHGIHVPRATTNLLLGGEEATQLAKPDEAFARRFDALMIWASKLIKAFEHTGVKFHNKPMWLPH